MQYDSPRNMRLDSIKSIFFMITYYVALIVLYRFPVTSLYVEYPSPTFSWIQFSESISAVILGSIFIRTQWRRPSEFYYFLLVISIFFPMCVIYQFSDFDRSYFYVIVLTIMVIGFIVNSSHFKVPFLVGGRNILISVMASFLIVTYVWLFYINRNFNFNIDIVYEERLYYREIVVGVWGYILSWVGRLVVPFFIGLSLFKKKYFLMLFFIILQLLLFPLTSHKSYAVMAIFPLFIYWVSAKRNNGQTVIALLLLGVAISGVLMFSFGNHILLGLLVQRSLFKPALLNFTYVEVFKDLDMVLLSNSKFIPFIEYKFDISPAFLVGEYLKGSDVTRSNTGFLGTGYMHFGLFGPLIFGIVVAFFMKILDAVSRPIPVWLACVFSFGPFHAMISSGDLIPSLFTNGVLLCLLLIWIVSYRLEKQRFGR